MRRLIITLFTFAILNSSFFIPNGLAETTWQAIGPFNGYVNSIAIDPTNSQIIYVGTYGGGIFKSTNGAASWTAVNIGITNKNILTLAIDPTNRLILYLGTDGGGGVFKSINGGASWSAVNTGMTTANGVNCFAIDPTNNQSIYAGTNAGVFKSANGGNSWMVSNSDITVPYIRSIAIDPMNTQTIYAGTMGGGLFKSTNGGISWTALINGITNNNQDGTTGTYVDCTAIALTTSQTVYVGTAGGVFKSTNGGEAWTAANSGITTPHIRSLAVVPNSQTIYAGTNFGVFRSINGGALWTKANAGITTSTMQVTSLVIDQTNSQTVYAGTLDGGVFKSTNSGTLWRAANNGLGALIQSLAIDPANAQMIYAGAAGGGIFKSNNGGTSWVAANSGLTGRYITSLVIDSTNGQTVYAGASGNGVFKSTNYAVSWLLVSDGMTNGDVRSLAIDPMNTQTIYAGTMGGVFKSTNSGTLWTEVTNGITNVFSLAIDPANSQTVYAGTWGDGLIKSTNGGESWTAANSGIPHLYVQSLAIAPDNSQTVYAGTYGGLFKSTNGGNSWTAVNSGVEMSTIKSLAIDPFNIQTVYAGTWGDGLFKSTNGGNSWTTTSNEMTNTNVLTLAIDRLDSQNIYAGTSQGAYKTLLSNDIPAITAAATATFSEETPGTFTVTASGWPDPQFSITGALPSGISFDTTTGTLSGTPANGSAGLYPLIVTATNGIPPDATRGLTLTVLPTTSLAASVMTPASSAKTASLSGITGTASGSALSKVEVQVTDGTYYLQTNGIFTITPTWLTASGTTSWSLDTSTVPWREGITYTISARASNHTVTSAPSSSTFTIVVPSSKAGTILSMTITPYSLRTGDSTTISGSLATADTTSVPSQPVTLIITPPSTAAIPNPAPIFTTLTTDSNGAFTSGALSLFAVPGVYMVQARFEGDSTLAASFTSQALGVTPQSGYAIIVTGKSPDNSLLDMHTASSDTIHSILVNKRGFLPENIQYLKSTASSPVTKQQVRAAITTWAKNKLIASPGPLYLIMIDHGNQSGFLLDTDTLTPDQLKGHLDTLESDPQVIASGTLTTHNRIIMIGSCYAGIFAKLSKPGRVVITSANTDEQSIAGFSIFNSGSNTTYYGGEYFIDALFSYLGRGDSLKDAFTQSSNMVELRDPRKVPAGTHAGVYDTLAQHPLMDDNGDNKASYLLDTDGLLAANLHLGVGIRTLGNPADITAVTETTTIPATQTGDIPLWLRVNDNSRIAKAWMEIRTPITSVSSSGGSGQVIPRLLTLPLYYDGLQWNGNYDFPNAGKYNILYYTQDNQTNDIAPAKNSIVYRQLTNNTAPNDFNLKSPNDGDGVSGMFTLAWQEVKSPNKITYTLHVATDQNFATEVYKEENIPQAATYMPRDGLKKPGTNQYYCQNGDSFCYWKVTAIDSYGATKESGIRSATIVATNALPGIIKGILRDATTGVPIAGATVTAVNTINAGSNPFTTLENGAFIMEATSGVYTITAASTGYKTKSLADIAITPGQVLDANMSLEVNTPPSAFNLISPDDEAATDPMFTLAWQESIDTDGLTYTLLVAKDQNFTNIVYREENIPQAATYTPKDALKDPNTGQYYCQNGDSYCYWKVQAIDIYGATTESDTRSFTIISTNALPGIIKGIIYSDLDYSRITTASLTAMIGGSDNNIFVTNGVFFLAATPGIVAITGTARGYQNVSSDVNVRAGEVTTVNIIMAVSAAVIMGDIDGLNGVTIADAILALQSTSGKSPSGIRESYATSGADVTGDRRIGLVEAIYILQKISGTRAQ